LLCADLFATVPQLISHYLFHQERDVNVLGMSRYMLRRQTDADQKE
jgi:hypothetical protein